jgi:hypothetical protein
MSHHRKYGNKLTEKHQRKFGEKLNHHYPSLGVKISHSYMGNEYKNGYDPVKGTPEHSDLERHRARHHHG